MRGSAKSSVQRFLRPETKFKFSKKSDARRNLTIFEILANGCFETDWHEYCVNRISGFSCDYWISLDDYYNGNNKENNTSPIIPQCYSDSIIDETHLSGFFKFIFTFVLLSSILFNILTLLTLRKFAAIYLPICHYFTYICCLQQLDCIILVVDWFVSSFTVYRPIKLLQFISQSSCQIIPMLFSIIRHLISSLLIGVSIDLWRFIQQPVLFLTKYRSEWVKNVFILCMVLICTINCQYFWTFDVNKGENKLLHGRLINDYMNCDFSNTIQLNLVFTRYLWPITDHLIGEILPFVICLVLALLCFKSINSKLTLKYPVNLSKVLINSSLVLELNKTLIMYLLTTCIIDILPRIFYFIVKISIDSSSSNTRRSSSFIASTISSNNNFNKFAMLDKSMKYRKVKNATSSILKHEFLKDGDLIIFVSNFIKYQVIWMVLARFLIFYVNMKEFRVLIRDYLHCINIFKFLRRFTNKKTTQNSHGGRSSNRYDNFNMPSSHTNELLIERDEYARQQHSNVLVRSSSNYNDMADKQNCDIKEPYRDNTIEIYC